MSRAGKRLTAGLLAVLAVVWLLVNGPVEGPVLVVLDSQHGVTLADLASVFAMLLAGLLLVSSRGR